MNLEEVQRAYRAYTSDSSNWINFYEFLVNKWIGGITGPVSNEPNSRSEISVNKLDELIEVDNDPEVNESPVEVPIKKDRLGHPFECEFPNKPTPRLDYLMNEDVVDSVEGNSVEELAGRVESLEDALEYTLDGLQALIDAGREQNKAMKALEKWIGDESEENQTEQRYLHDRIDSLQKVVAKKPAPVEKDQPVVPPFNPDFNLYNDVLKPIEEFKRVVNKVFRMNL